MKTWGLILALAGSATLLEAGELRTWTDVSGAKVEAEYMSSNKDSVTVRGKNLKNMVVPLDKLSEADQDYVKDQQKAEAEASIIKVNLKGDIVWRLDNQYRSMSLSTMQKAEIWTWDEEAKAPKEKLSTVTVKYSFDMGGARND